jgi:chromosome condensin MukBEF ATPase and DNA-binding subunit MukB
METLLISMCVVTLLLVTVLTLVNYKTTKVLKEEITNLNFLLHSSYVELKNSTNTLHMNLEEVSHNTIDHIDSSIKKLNDILNDVTKEQEIQINYNKEQISTLSLNVETLVKEIRKVEKGYKEKINY